MNKTYFAILGGVVSVCVFLGEYIFAAVFGTILTVLVLTLYPERRIEVDADSKAVFVTGNG
jgi:hypothetical protein